MRFFQSILIAIYSILLITNCDKNRNCIINENDANFYIRKFNNSLQLEGVIIKGTTLNVTQTINESGMNFLRINQNLKNESKYFDIEDNVSFWIKENQCQYVDLNKNAKQYDVLYFYDIFDEYNGIELDRKVSFKIYLLEDSHVLFLHSLKGAPLWIDEFNTSGITYFAYGRIIQKDGSKYSYLFESAYTYPEQNIFEDTFLLPVMKDKNKIKVNLEIQCELLDKDTVCHFANKNTKFRSRLLKEKYISFDKIQ
ncbi:hypothetical protein CH354_07275 [Leptospira levettii]|uniref:hypothetical protein n=1 Tax=Leptospira levettii TaxID=2023178 RepID=UPI000C29BFCD|nr:hypothetical protein [Leptospira levettii]MCW7474671.1 hypothetical protein [Leptospira levettii]PJZ38972.1 hypothetical protein CH354_07275 [Leptospira levettii]PJZ90672.1 hypothetical protein CH368_00185 [Leptospira levettii]PKA02272.1 hypothetical protein CH369_03700 [Leptospira levettii]